MGGKGTRHEQDVSAPAKGMRVRGRQCLLTMPAQHEPPYIVPAPAYRALDPVWRGQWHAEVDGAHPRLPAAHSSGRVLPPPVGGPARVKKSEAGRQAGRQAG
jgi:hypothetical protein